MELWVWIRLTSRARMKRRRRKRAPMSAAPRMRIATAGIAAARAWGLRLLDLNRPAVEARAVEAADGLLSFLRSRHLDEAETARPPGVPVGDDARGLDAAGGREGLAQALVRGGE